jgi:hypothetical protein
LKKHCWRRATKQPVTSSMLKMLRAPVTAARSNPNICRILLTPEASHSKFSDAGANASGGPRVYGIAIFAGSFRH